MKKSIYTLATALLITGTTLVSCKENTENKGEEVEVITNDEGNSLMVKSATQNKEWEAFKVNTDSLINKNDMRIAELKVKMNNTGKAADSTYKNKIAQLEERNAAMKVKIQSYKDDSSQNWDSFKTEFNHDMNELGSALKDLTVDNKK
jgi:hypothetical protein